MPQESAEEKVAKLEARLAKLEARGNEKDRWDKFQILASLLIPAAVGFAGYYFSNALADAQREAEEHRAQASQELAEASTRVSQAELISTFMKSLLSENKAEKTLAIRAVILALPEEGPQLVRAIQTGSMDQETRVAARAALVERRDKLVEELHAGDEPSRQRAARALVAGFRQDPELAPQIVTAAEKHPGDEAGFVRSKEVLNAVPSEQVANPETVQRLGKYEELRDEKARALFQQVRLRAQPAALAPPATAERHE
jgi:hypothetical protein